MSGYKTARASAGAPPDPKTVTVHNMHVQLKQERDNRKELCSSGLEHVRSRGQESTSGRPSRQRLRRTAGQKRSRIQCDSRGDQQSRTGKHIRPPWYTYLTQIGNHKKDDVEAEEGRADHRKRGSAGGAPRREDTPHRK